MKAVQKNRGNLIISILTEKCPNCGEGQVFKPGTKLFQIPVMHKRCEVCNYKFDREPGYFLGAMYISYGFAVLLAIITFLITRWLLPDIAIGWYPVFIVAVLLLFARKNYKLARVIYMHIFPW